MKDEREEADFKLAKEVAEEQLPREFHMEKLWYAKGFAQCLHMVREKFLVIDFEKRKKDGEGDSDA